MTNCESHILGPYSKEEAMEVLEKIGRPQERTEKNKYKHERTKSTLIDSVLIMLSLGKNTCPDIDAQKAVVKLMHHFHNSEQFETAINTIADELLALFPNPEDPETAG